MFSRARMPIDPMSKRLAFSLSWRETTKPLTSEAKAWNRVTAASARSTEPARALSFPPVRTARIALSSLRRRKRAVSSIWETASASTERNESANFDASAFATFLPRREPGATDKRVGAENRDLTLSLRNLGGRNGGSLAPPEPASRVQSLHRETDIEDFP